MNKPQPSKRSRQLPARRAVRARRASGSKPARNIPSPARGGEIAEAPRVSEPELRAIFAAMTENIFVLDAAGRFLKIAPTNPAFHYRAPDQMLGKRLHDIFPPARASLALDYVRRVLETRQTLRLEYSLRIDGRPTWFAANVAPLTTDSVIWVARDITERKRIEESEHEQRLLADALRDSAAALNGTLNYDEVLDRIMANIERVVPHDAAGVMLVEAGVARNVRTRGFAERGLETFIARFRLRVADAPDLREMVATGKPIVIQDTRDFPDWVNAPETNWIRSSVKAPIRIKDEIIGFLNLDSSAPGFFTAVHAERLQIFADQVAVALENARLFASLQQELAERKRAEEALRESEERFRRIIESTQAFLVNVDTHGRFAYLNDAAARTLGYRNAEQLIGKPYLDFVHPEDRKRVRRAYLTQFATRQESLFQEFRALDAAGNIRWLSFLSNPIIKDGQVIGETGIAQDITERKLAAEETQRRANEFAALYEMAGDLGTQQDLSALLNTIVERASQMFNVPSGAIFLYDSARGDLRLETSKGFQLLAGTRQKLGEGIAGRVAQTRQPMVIRDYRTWEQRSPLYAGQPITAVLQVPMLYQGELIGVLAVNELDPTEREFVQADVHLLTLLAGQAASAVYNARLFAETQERAQRQDALYRVSTSLVAMQGERELCETVVRACREILGYPYLGIFLVDSETGDRVLSAQSGWDDAPTDWRIQPGEGISQKAIVTGELQYCADVTREPNYVPGLRESHSELDVPIKIGAAVLGVLIVEDTRVDAFDAGDFGVLQAVANQLAVALQNTRLYLEVREREERYRRQATRLQVAADVARVVTSELDIDQVLPRVVDLLCERFGYYHAGVLLLDAAGEWAILRASSSPAIHHELENVLKLRVGEQGMVGFTTRTGEPRIAQDVTTDPTYFSHPSLPDTRAEAVLPLLIGDQVLGALDVQSTAPNVFTANTVAILAMIADQIAVAIQNARLHQMEKERARELENAYRTLQENQEKLLVVEKMASLGRLTAGIAHEMNTPLAAVRAALAELEKLDVEYQDSIGDSEVSADDHRAIAQEMQHSIQLAQNAAERAAGFVRGIKSQTRDLASTERRRFNAVTVIEEVLLLLRHALREKNCTATFAPAIENLEMFGSPGRLAQVVTNLVTNAIDASADGGGGPIAVRLVPYDHGIELQTSDQGCGIPPENLSKIFDPMFTTKPFGEGTGLGLALVHDIITGEFGGTVQVTSQVGQGTTFTVRFPQRKEA